MKEKRKINDTVIDKKKTIDGFVFFLGFY